MTEQDNQASFEERMAACPIHQWADISGYLERAEVPECFWEPFHGLVIARGQYPNQMSAEQGEEFGRCAVDITYQYGVQPKEAQALKMMFGQLIEQWLARKIRFN